MKRFTYVYFELVCGYLKYFIMLQMGEQLRWIILLSHYQLSSYFFHFILKETHKIYLNSNQIQVGWWIHLFLFSFKFLLSAYRVGEEQDSFFQIEYDYLLQKFICQLNQALHVRTTSNELYEWNISTLKELSTII